MIQIEHASFFGLLKESFFAVRDAPLSKDPDIYREDTSVLTLQPGYGDPGLIVASDGAMRFVLDTNKYFPEHAYLKVAAEDEYWNEKIVSSSIRTKVVAHLEDNPQSRSCLYVFWNNEDFLVANPKGACVTQLYFRLRGEGLEMHAHLRANDVHRCLFIDLAYLTFIHQQICDALGSPKGRYVQFVDSLHTYNKAVGEFDAQLTHIEKTPHLWI